MLWPPSVIAAYINAGGASSGIGGGAKGVRAAGRDSPEVVSEQPASAAVAIVAVAAVRRERREIMGLDTLVPVQGCAGCIGISARVVQPRIAPRQSYPVSDSPPVVLSPR